MRLEACDVAAVCGDPLRVVDARHESRERFQSGEWTGRVTEQSGALSVTWNARRVDLKRDTLV